LQKVEQKKTIAGLRLLTKKDVKMKIQKIEKIIKDIEVLTIQSFNEKYPSWISNSLTTVELTLKKTLKERMLIY